MYTQLYYQMSKFELFGAFTKAGGKVLMPNGMEGIIQSLTRESGCGRSYIVHVLTDNNPSPAGCDWFVVKTTD